MAINYNTVRLKAEFKTFDDEYADPIGITLKIYDKLKEQIGETISISTVQRVSTGIYEYDYLLPLDYTSIVYEFSGTLNGEIITGRSSIDCTWT